MKKCVPSAKLLFANVVRVSNKNLTAVLCFEIINSSVVEQKMSAQFGLS